jgi:hypothetical protein
MATRKVADKTNGGTPKATRKVRGPRISPTKASPPKANSKLDLASAVDMLSHEQTRSELATAAVVGAVAVLVEAELLPGILLGVGAIMLAKLFPGITGQIRPLVKSTIGLGYKAMGKTQELMAEASEHAQDMLAEIKADAGKSHPPQAKPSAAIKPHVH